MSIQPGCHEPHPPGVLIVDDDPDVLQMLTICLGKSGFSTTGAANAQMAYNLLEQEPYAAIVTDVNMPEEDGITFLARVYKAWPELPVILMTGHAQLQMAVDAIKNGAFDFVYKPFDFVHLRKIVERAVNYTKLKQIEKNYRAELEETVASRTAELKDAMADLDFYRFALLKAVNDKNNAISNISHEMRTPMNGVIGALELLAEEGVFGVQAEYLAMARQSADEMLSMVNHLLSFSQGSGPGVLSASHNPVDLTGLLNTLIAEHRAKFEAKKIALNLHIAPDVPGQIWTDEEQLLRLLNILLGNALKFTDCGEVSLKAEMADFQNDSNFLQFTVTDSGVGIPEGMLEQIFEPFVQGDGSFTRCHGGVGLGLSIARKISLLLNGHLVAEHVPGGGSSFIFRLRINAQN